MLLHQDGKEQMLNKGVDGIVSHLDNCISLPGNLRIVKAFDLVIFVFISILLDLLHQIIAVS